MNAAEVSMQQLNTETLPELERLLVELNQLAPSLRRLIEQTERNPASLLFGRKQVPEGPGETRAPEASGKSSPRESKP